MERKNLVQRITEILEEMKIPRTRVGYTYIMEAVKVAYASEKYLYHKHSVLYPGLANRFNVTTISVEKAIRDCIKSGWQNMDKETIKRIYGNNIKERGPSNSEFLCKVIDLLKE